MPRELGLNWDLNLPAENVRQLAGSCRGFAGSWRAAAAICGQPACPEIGARASKPRGRGRRTGALREPNAAQLLRSMKNPEALKDVLALQAPLQQALQN